VSDGKRLEDVAVGARSASDESLLIHAPRDRLLDSYVLTARMKYHQRGCKVRRKGQRKEDYRHYAFQAAWCRFS